MDRKVIPGSFSLMKKMNTSLILNTIRDKGPVSRAKIAKITGLTPATVTNITAELIDARLVLEAERGESSGGRKPVMLRINSNGYYVAGVYIGSKNVEIIIANLNADIIYFDSIDIDSTISSEYVLDNIIQKINFWMSNNEKKKILGVGVGVHGLIKSSEGISVFAPNLGWENVYIRDILENGLNIPVYIDNDVRAMTIGESWFGVAKDISNFVFIFVGYGIGGSIVIDNQLYRGISEGAGEIGHTTIEINGPQCSCGNYGCLQALASEQAMVNKAKELMEKDKSILHDWIAGDISNLTPDLLFDAALANDPIALQVIKEETKYLGVGIANLINTFNPSMVVINGRIIKLEKIIMDEIKKEVEKRSMKYLLSSTNIICSRLSQQAVLKGAVALVLNKAFDNPKTTYTLYA